MVLGVGCQVFWPAGMVWRGELRLKLRLTLRLTLRLRLRLTLRLTLRLMLRLSLRLRLSPSWKICCDIHSPWQVVVGFGGGCQVSGQLGWQEGGA